MSEEIKEEIKEEENKGVVIPPMEVKIIADKIEVVEEDMDYIDTEITDEEVKEFENER